MTVKMVYMCLHNIHCVEKKAPTPVFVYIYLENVYIYTKFSLNV